MRTESVLLIICLLIVGAGVGAFAIHVLNVLDRVQRMRQATRAFNRLRRH